MPSGYVMCGGLHVHQTLASAVRDIAAAAGMCPEAFWESVGGIIEDLAPVNAALLRKRDAVQAQLDAWHLQRVGQQWSPSEYEAFLRQIGYIVPVGAPFKAATSNVDDAIRVCGPQLVVPISNPRFAINAANSRFRSLTDAFYGTTAGPPPINGAEKTKKYNPVRGKLVYKQVHAFLDEAAPLLEGTYDDVVLFARREADLVVTLKNGNKTALKQPEKFVGYNEDNSGDLAGVLLRNNGMHIELVISDKGTGKTHPARLQDVVLESAVTAIMDFEDSVAAVDAGDKALVYTNWSKLMQGTIACAMPNGSKRVLKPDKTFSAVGTSGTLSLQGRSLMLVRHVGLHLYTDAVLDAKGRPVPESLLDAAITALAALPDINNTQGGNSRKGSMYCVRPKMHGPEEVAFACTLFSRVEKALSLPHNTLKMGIMDEERRTTVNLYECIRQAKERVVFINTGFLDRTGDEIHTSFEAGPVMPKSGIAKATWRVAYEDWNVDVGIQAGLLGVAQIGKGMWAKPDELGEMLNTKAAHPKSGATCAWVPSPTAATLHAIHYHQVDVRGVQRGLALGGPRAKLSDILRPPFQQYPPTAEVVKHELEECAQGILGYVVRWVQQGIGCSKVPDLDNVGLMEDRATLRISSQILANWIHHGVCSTEQVVAVMRKMAVLVDKQNGSDPLYSPLSPTFSNTAWKAAMELVLRGKEFPNGYTEFALTKWRRSEKGVGNAGNSKL